MDDGGRQDEPEQQAEREEQQAHQAHQDPRGPGLTAEQRKLERIVLLFFGIATLAGIGLFVIYFLGGQTQFEGICWALALGGLGLGIGVWGG